MFNVGDWVWGINEYDGSKTVANLLVVGDVGQYYLCFDSMTCDELNFEENMEEIYGWYSKLGCGLSVTPIKEENTFATEEEAREVLEVIA